MKWTHISIVIASLFAVGHCRFWGGRCHRDGEPCTPYNGYHEYNVCGERMVTTTTTNVTSGYGPNVCKTVYVYSRNGYRHVYSGCRCVRAKSNICDVPLSFTRTKYHCCDGYTTQPKQSDNHHYWYEPHSSRILRSEGCPIVVQDNVLDCLDELNLTEIRTLFARTEVDPVPDGLVTLFALENKVVVKSQLTSLESSDVEEVLRRHLINTKVQSVKFANGQSYETLLGEGCNLHVTEIDRPKTAGDPYTDDIFISGSKIIARDACIAKNGIVHIVSQPLECSNRTIAEIVEDEPTYSTLESLLTLANKLRFLDNEKSQLTLFAPTDDAFDGARASLGFDLVACLRNNIKVLKKFLKYHIVWGAEFGTTLLTRESLKTKACRKVRHSYWYWKFYYRCETIPVSVGSSGIELGDDGVIVTGLDIEASNGVIHEISLPLLVPSVDFNEVCEDFLDGSGDIFVPPPPPMSPPPK